MDLLYLHDGCGPRRAKRVAAFLDANGVYALPCLEQSPDSSPTENIWAIMKWRLLILPYYLTSAEKSFVQLREIWNDIQDDYFTKLSDSIVYGCNAMRVLFHVFIWKNGGSLYIQTFRDYVHNEKKRVIVSTRKFFIVISGRYQFRTRRTK